MATSNTKSAASSGKDACDLLDADHKAVTKMFKEYEELVEAGGNTKQKRRLLAERICNELTVHTQLEEEIFYPPLRKAIKDKMMFDEAEVEHKSAKTLIAEIEQMDPSDPLFDAKVVVLGEYVDHHVKEERKEMFPKARESKVDLVAMREQIEARKQELMAGYERV